MSEPARIWVAYYSDWSEIAIFAEEIDCLRYAVDHVSMEVAHLELGRSVQEQIREQWAARNPTPRTVVEDAQNRNHSA